MANRKKKRGPPPKTSRSTPQRTSPAFVTPMAAQVVKRLPEGNEWVYELKFDGYRALLLKDGQRVEIRSRPASAKSLSRIPPLLLHLYQRVSAPSVDPSVELGPLAEADSSVEADPSAAVAVAVAVGIQ
jgi:hypothetical protein